MGLRPPLQILSQPHLLCPARRRKRTFLSSRLFYLLRLKPLFTLQWHPLCFGGLMFREGGWHHQTWPEVCWPQTCCDSSIFQENMQDVSTRERDTLKPPGDVQTTLLVPKVPNISCQASFLPSRKQHFGEKHRFVLRICCSACSQLEVTVPCVKGLWLP